MNEKRYNKAKQEKSVAKQSDRDDLLAILKNLKDVAKSWGYADVVAEIERRENSLNVNTLTKQAYRSCLRFIKNTESKLKYIFAQKSVVGTFRYITRQRPIVVSC